MQGYCLKCREKREMVDPQEVTLKNGRPAMQGTCTVCGTKITVIGGKKAAETVAASDKSDNIPGGAGDGAATATKAKTETKTKAAPKSKAKAAAK